MYSVTKRIEFCYGHRLLDYDGICKHPHGHNASAEIEIRTGQLDSRNMVCDFSDIKRVVKGWIDKELDHKMLLRHDDRLVKPLQQLVDSWRDLANSMSALLVGTGAAPLPEVTIGRMVGEGAATLVARAFAAAERQPSADALDRFLAIYDDHLLDHTRPYAGIPDVL